MNISNNTARAFQKLDSNRNGVSVEELKKAAGGDNQLSTAEAQNVGITDPQDIETINQSLKRAQSNKMDPSEILFPALTEGIDDITDLHPEDADVSTRIQRLNVDLMHPRSDAMNGSFNLVRRNSSGTEVNLNALDGVQNQAEIRQGTLDSLGGTAPEAEAYLQTNYSAVAAGLGDDLGDRYNGHVKLTGDADALTAFQTPGADDIVVCTDIHASLTAWHNANGNEAYTVSTSSNDAAHVFTIFKDPSTDKWNIQNYGTVVETDAKDVRDLYDRYMPGQRNIRFYSVDDKGNLNQERKVNTAVGMREWDFRNNLGAGNYDPSTAKQGVELGSLGVSATFGRFNVNANLQNGTVGLNYHVQQQKGSGSQVTQGVGVELQDHTENGYTTRRADAKYERRSSTFEQHSSNHLQQTNRHVSAYAGVEEASGSPIYWRETSDGSTPVGDNDLGVRFGAQYNNVNNHYFRLGESNSFFLTGHETTLGATGTLSASSSGADVYETYAGRMVNDLNAKISTPVGLAYMTPTAFVQGGVSLGMNAANIDGKEVGEQIGNMFEANAFVEGRWQPSDRFSLVGMGNVDLKHSTSGEFVGQFGGGAEFAVTPRLNWTTMGLVDIDTQLGSRGGVRTGFNYAPKPNISIGVNTGLTMDGRPTVNGGLRLNF